MNPNDAQLEIAHVLFIDIVGYSKLLTNEQRERLQELNRIVRETEQFRAAEANDKLVRIPTDDGMVLAFFTSPDACERIRASRKSSPARSRRRFTDVVAVGTALLSGVSDPGYNGFREKCL